jgi:4-amino-4-deoxy-L-arabinose transferase-like glycosyltransferase
MTARQKNQRTAGRPANGKRALVVWGVLLAILIVAAAVRVRLLDVPLERDEGEYAYAGQLILRGVPPYESVYNMKLPGIYVVYAVTLAVFGETARAIHLGLLVVNAASIVLVFLIGRRLRDDVTGAVAAASFALMSLSPAVQGVFANAEHFVLLPALGGLLVTLVATDRDRSGLLFWSGVLLGLAMVVKQHGAAFAASAGLYLLIDGLFQRPVDARGLARRLGLLAGGALLPVAITVAILATTGVLDRFRFWAIDYGMTYAAQVPMSAGVQLFRNRAAAIVESAPLLWLAAGAGFLVTAIRWRGQKRTFLVLLTAFSIVAVSIGLYFRPHYFVLALPAAALLAGVMFGELTGRLDGTGSRFRRVVPLVLVGVVFGLSVTEEWDFLFVASPTEISRRIYHPNPFVESVAIAEHLRENSDPDDRVAVLGSEPQIYFHADRRSATGYVYAYPLMEEQPFALEMQNEMIREIEEARPRFIVYVGIEPSWRQRAASPMRIFQWFQRYQAEHYTRVGLVEVLPDGSRYSWGPETRWPPSSPHWISVLERVETSHSR